MVMEKLTLSGSIWPNIARTLALSVPLFSACLLLRAGDPTPDIL